MIYSLLDCKKAFIESLNHSHETEDPYPLWQIDNVFPTEAVNDLLDIKTKLTTMEYSLGRREENNDKRGFFDVDRRRNVPACDTISNLFQDSDTVHAIEEKFGIDLAGTYLRIEFSQDSDGFWLEPHTDIGAKKFTMVLGLSKDDEAPSWGTSIYRDKNTFLHNAPYESNRAFVFIPSDNSWHGFNARTINGVRKGLIINYVTEEWRARHELSFPDDPIQK